MQPQAFPRDDRPLPGCPGDIAQLDARDMRRKLQVQPQVLLYDQVEEFLIELDAAGGITLRKNKQCRSGGRLCRRPHRLIPPQRVRLPALERSIKIVAFGARDKNPIGARDGEADQQ